MPQLFANNAYSALASALSNVATSIALTTGTGSRFPSPSGGDYFLATLVGLDGNGNENAWEIVKCTARTTDTLTVVRAQESTVAVAWSAGARLELRATAGTFEGVLARTGGTLTGDLTFSGTGRKILGDFSNATASLRTAFQTSTTNGNTNVTAKPNGAGVASYFIAHNAADADNAGFTCLGITSTEVLLKADKTGTGGLLPIGLYSGGARQVQVPATVGAVNYLTLSGSTTGNNATIAALGTDTDIDIAITPKGAGALITSGNLAVNGGSITTTQTTANLLNDTATTLNIGGAATALTLGATTGTMTLRNPTIVGSQATQALFNTVATTLNIGGAATAVNIGAATGVTTINNTALAKAYRETYSAIGASNIDLAAGNYFSRTISGATTFTVSNTAASGLVSSFVLELTNGGSATVTWFAGVDWPGGTAPTLTAAGIDVLAFFTRDGGTNWRGFLVGADSK